MIEQKTSTNVPDDTSESPPYFQSWRTWYTAILLELVILIIIFRVITVVFE